MATSNGFIKCKPRLSAIQKLIVKRSLSIFVAWLPTLLYLAIWCIPHRYWCTPVTPSGKEFVCGYSYARPIVQLFADGAQWLGACAFIIAIWLAASRRLPKLGWVGLCLSTVMLMLYFIAKMMLGAEDSP